MLKNLLHQVGELPPVHWVTHLDLWHHAPFVWVGELLNWVFGQHLLKWSTGQVSWLIITMVVVPFMTLEMLWWIWSWMRGRQIGYDEHKAKFWTSGPREGNLKAKPINLARARARRFAWPQLGLPFYLVATGMYLWYLAWPTMASAIFLAMMWFVFTPVRRIMFIAVARKAYRANNPSDRLDTTLFEDVYNYFHTGLSRPASKQKDIDPPFESTGWFYRLLNAGYAFLVKHRALWRLLCFWRLLRFWGVLAQLAVSFFWPIAVVVAPFAYMAGVEDYEQWMNPWWRRYQKQQYHGKIVRGEVIKSTTA